MVSGFGPVMGGLAEPVLTVREAAAALRVATSTVYKLCAETKLGHVRVSNAIRIPSSAVAVHMRNQRP